MAVETLTDTTTQQTWSSGTKPLPLESGDRLTRREFERRYDAMPNLKKAELIEGVVYMPSPVRTKNHGIPHGHIILWIGTYSAATAGTNFADNATLRLDPDNEPQPDISLWIDENCGGHSSISEDDYLEGGPELIIEIAASSASYDSHEKLKIYRRNGIQEYIIWSVYDRAIDWYSLQDEEYVRLTPDSEGVIESRFFAGLRLNIEAMLSGDLAKVLEDLQEGISSAEHENFVQTLANAKKE